MQSIEFGARVPPPPPSPEARQRREKVGSWRSLEKRRVTARQREKERLTQRDREQGIDQHVVSIGSYGKNPASVESWNMAYFGKHSQATKVFTATATAIRVR